MQGLTLIIGIVVFKMSHSGRASVLSAEVWWYDPKIGKFKPFCFSG